MEDKIRWIDIFRKYDPDITEKQATFLLWNETCYPFDDETTVRQIEQFYEKIKTVITKD